MATYFLRRGLILLVTLAGILAVVFFSFQLAPGDAAAIKRGTSFKVSPEALATFRALNGLDLPIGQRFMRWSGNLVRGDLGRSFQDGRPVLARISETLPNTLILNLASLVFTLLVAVPAGIWAGARRGSFFDRASGVGFFMLMSLPSFWIALLLGSLFAVQLGWLPLLGMVSDGYDQLGPLGRLGDRLLHLVLPTLSLSIASLAFFSRLARSSVLEVVRQDYIRTARAKGLPERSVLFRHALANALLPMVTILGLLIPAMISGSVIIERIFSWPGTGQLFFDAILVRDYPMVMGLTLFTALLTLAGNLVSDVLYAVVDPRVRLS